jgi:hypothetical protein
MSNRKSGQLLVLTGLTAVYALLAFTYYVYAPLDQSLPAQNLPEVTIDVPQWVLGLANAGIILVVYGLLGLIGYWLAAKLQLPGIFKEDAGRQGLLTSPALYGLALGIIIVIVDRLFALSPDKVDLIHPPFPYSVIAAVTAAIGEEILFRLFLLSLWVALLSLILRRLRGTVAVLWIANALAAVAFAAAHLPAAMLLLGVASPAELPNSLLVEIILLNGIVGLVAGLHYVRNGLVAAIGVHFWADIVLHVVSPLAAAS